MAETDISISSAALVLVGANAITSFSDDLKEAQVAGTLYPKIVAAKLTGHPWRFASVTKSLGAKLTAAPQEGWDFAYQLPTEPPVLEIRTVLRDDRPVSYDIEGDKIFCDEEEDVSISYLWRVPENKWPPWFVWAVTLELAAAFAVALDRNEKGEELRAVNGPVERAWLTARKSNSQQQTTKKLTKGRLIAARIG